MDNVTNIRLEPAQRGDIIALQVPGATVLIRANVTDERGQVTTLVEVRAANDERGGDEHGDTWAVADVQDRRTRDHGHALNSDARVTLVRRGPLMTNPADYGQLIRDRLADIGLDGVLRLADDCGLRLGQVTLPQRDAQGNITLLGGDRVLVGRPKITPDRYQHYVYSPRAQREVLVPHDNLHIEAAAPRWAYWVNPVQDDRRTGGFVPSVVVEEVPGHWPLVGEGRPWVWGATLAEAKTTCAGENQRRRLDPEQVAKIVHTSIVASYTASAHGE